MELKGVSRYAWATLMIGGGVAFIVFSFEKIRELGDRSLSILFENFILGAISAYLLLFLSLLIIRYAVLILYSFMEHLEYILRRKHHPQNQRRDDNLLPMITLVVPAYNEGLVIQPALRSLLLLDYPNYEILVIDDGSTDDTYEKALAVAREPH